MLRTGLGLGYERAYPSTVRLSARGRRVNMRRVFSGGFLFTVRALVIGSSSLFKKHR